MSGYLLLLSLGTVWTFISVIAISGKRAGISSSVFYFLGNSVASLCCLLYFLLPGMTMDDFTAPGKRNFLFCYLLGSVFNGLGQAVTMYNLKSGGRAIALAIPQMAFLLPFICGILFWNEPVNWIRLTGMFIVAAAVLVAGLCKQDPDGKSNWNPRRFYIALVAVALIGLSQVMVVMAGYVCAGNEVGNMTRTFFYMLTAAIFFGVISYLEIRKNGLPPRKSIKWGIIWGIIAPLSNMLLFYCLDIFAKSNQSGIVYAVGAVLLMIGTCIYTRVFLKEKLAVMQYAGVAGMIIGLLMVRLGGV
ncbi:MAG: hypothetical protein IKA87_08335 [Lentisphaeria bacterium]|nr:hypothetical protein [Lentisphaeria bacterium]